jgi:hypothetical protein
MASIDLQSWVNLAQQNQPSYYKRQWDLESTVNIPAGVILYRQLFIVTQPMTRLFNMAERSGLVECCIIANNNVTTDIIRGSNQNNIRIEQLQVLSAGTANILFFNNCENTLITRNNLQEGLNAIHLRGNCSNSIIHENTGENWNNRFIWALNGADNTTGVQITNNTIKPYNRGSTGARQPIAVQSGGGYHDKIIINRNTVTGYDDFNDDASADQISLHRGKDFKVNNNQSFNSKEVGINVSRGSTKGQVLGNIAGNNATVGINIGANGNGISDRCSYISVNSNSVYDNGWNVINNQANRAGIGVRFCDNIDILGNSSFDSGVGHQLNGIYIANSTNVQRESNIFNNVIPELIV